MSESINVYTFIAIRNTFFSQICIGISANTILLLFHILTFLLQHRPKPTDLMVSLLALIHLVMLVTRVFMDIDKFGSWNFWDEITCKSVIYLYRLMKSLSVCTTCLLSVHQAIILSSRSSCLAKFKHKSSHHSLCCFFVLWVFSIFINARFLISIAAPTNKTTLRFVSESCSISPMGYFLKNYFTTIGVFRDILFIGLMTLSSGYMVILLCRHKRQSQHLRGTTISSKASAEQRATWTILLLMSFFVIMYFLDCIVCSSYEVFLKDDPARLWVQMLVGSGYATINPLLLISTEKRIIKAVKVVLGKDSKC